MEPGGTGIGWGRVTLKPVPEFTSAEWSTLYRFFRDRELADWNDARPIRLPEWLFRRVMLEEEATSERAGFGVLGETGELIGSAELYDLRPPPPTTPTVATLGVMIGVRPLWGQGYGREAVMALLAWAFAGERDVGQRGRARPVPLSRVRLTTFGHNRRAQRAFLACGFREVGRTSTHGRTDVHMEITRGEWLDARAGA